MTPRTQIWMTVLVLLGIGALFAIKLAEMFSFSLAATPQKYLDHNDVRGVAIVYRELPYTLNFEQQNSLIDFVNRAVPVKEASTQAPVKPDITKIIVYRFDDTPDVQITPLNYVGDNLLFSAPQLYPDGVLTDLSQGKLRELLKTAHD